VSIQIISALVSAFTMLFSMSNNNNHKEQEAEPSVYEQFYGTQKEVRVYNEGTGEYQYLEITTYPDGEQEIYNYETGEYYRVEEE